MVKEENPWTNEPCGFESRFIGKPMYGGIGRHGDENKMLS